MKTNLHDLYTDLIRKHNEKPLRLSKAEFESQPIPVYNPVCGDKFTLYLSAGRNPLQQLSFEGFGCAISRASLSIMLDLIEGKPVSEARELGQAFIRFLHGEKIALPEELYAFTGIRDYPERFDCAALPWIALESYFKVNNT